MVSIPTIIEHRVSKEGLGREGIKPPKGMSNMGEIHFNPSRIGHPGGLSCQPSRAWAGGGEERGGEGGADLWRKGRCGRTRSRGIRGSPRSGGRPRCPRRPAASVPGASPPAPLPYASTPSGSSRRRTSGAPSLSPEPEISGRSPRRHSPDGERKAHPSNPTPRQPRGCAGLWSRKRMEELRKAALLSSSHGVLEFTEKKRTFKNVEGHNVNSFQVLNMLVLIQWPTESIISVTAQQPNTQIQDRSHKNSKKPINLSHKINHTTRGLWELGRENGWEGTKERGLACCWLGHGS